MFCSQLDGETGWYIDTAMQGEKFLHSNPWGERYTDEYNELEIVELRDDVAAALNERRHKARGLTT